jgi:type IV pilus biogenesis protein PilP
MELPKGLKSKKLVIGAGAVGMIVVGFFLLKLATSTGDDGVPEKPRSSHRTTGKKISKPRKEEPKKSPLFKAMEALKDPFRTENPRAVELQDKLSLTQKEVEYLRATLEEKKLRQEIKKIERSLSESDQAGLSGREAEVLSPGGKKGDAEPQEKRVLVKAILITDEERSALLVSGNKKTWVQVGEFFDGWRIKEIRGESVVLSRGGKTFVLFYDRPGITGQGES